MTTCTPVFATTAHVPSLYPLGLTRPDKRALRRATGVGIALLPISLAPGFWGKVGEVATDAHFEVTVFVAAIGVGFIPGCGPLRRNRPGGTVLVSAQDRGFSGVSSVIPIVLINSIDFMDY